MIDFLDGAAHTAGGPAQPRRAPRWEVLLGLLLLLGLLAGAGWDWWQQSDHLAHYQAGTRAAAAHDWDTAHAAFLAADHYGDAPDRAADAAKQIVARDTAYARAVQEASAASWVAALRDLRRVQEVQPGYRYTARRARQAEQQVYTLALSGTVALRSLAQPPGLYLGTSQGWIWLTGSDAQSVLTTSSTCPYAIYDVPPGATPRPATPATAAGPAGRQLVAARLVGGRIAVTRLDFTRAGYDSFLCSKYGVLGVLLTPAIDSPPDSQAPAPPSGFYQAFGSARARLVMLPPGARVVDTALDGELIVSARQAAGVDTGITLYVQDLAGRRAPVTVPVGPGRPMRLAIGPDGRHLLLTTATPAANGSETYAIQLIDLADQWAGGILYSWTVASPSGNDDLAYEAAFVTEGPQTGDVLINGTKATDAQAWLVDPAPPQRVLWAGSGGAGQRLTAAAGFDQGLLLSWDDYECGLADKGTPSRGTLVYLDAAYRAMTLDPGLKSTQAVSRAWTSGARLVVEIADNCWSAVRAYQVAGLPLPAPGRTPGKLAPVYSVGVSSPGPQEPDWVLGQALLAYMERGALHVRDFTGTADLVLDTGITALYAAAP